jgi:hypothetical protein
LYTENNNILIDTCNNEEWDIKPELQKYNFEYIDELEVHYDIGFWYFEKDVIIYNTEEYSWCKEHYSDIKYIFDKETKMCPDCYTGKTFTERNNFKPKEYIGLNIRRYHISQEEQYEFKKRNSSNTKINK